MSGGVDVIYRVRGTRARSRGAETITELRRTWPAAQRLAQKWQDMGRGPISIEAAVLPESHWRVVR